MDVLEKNHVKTYSDTYLYSKYPKYNQVLARAIMQDPIIDKGSDAFKDVVYEVNRTRVSEAIVRVLNSPNTILLDCVEPLPRALKVFVAKDMKSNDKKVKLFIDCTGVITKSKTSSDLIVDEMKLISYLINGTMCMVYNKLPDKILSRTTLIMDLATCFAKAFTYVIDYLIKISIQETSKIKVMYMSAMYFLHNIIKMDDKRAIEMTTKIAGISEREAMMLNILLDKVSRVKNVPEKDTDPFNNIKTFIIAMREVMHFNPKAITLDVVIQRWMTMYGVSTTFALEFFPAISAMMTDAYIGSHLNQQKTIENICKDTMVSYSKQAISLINQII